MTNRIVICALLCLTGCASAGRDSGASLRVLTYNIHAGKDAAQQRNLDRVAEVIRGASADIVLLQEIDRNTERSGREDHIAVLAQLTGMHMAFAKSLDFQGGLYGIAVLSRLPLDTAYRVPLEVKPPQERSGTYEPRVGLHAVVRTARGVLHIVNTHIDPAPEPTYRHQEVVNLMAHIARTVPAEATLIFGGDLNARANTPEIAALSLAFLDSWQRCGDGGPGFSYPADKPDRRIDYVWLRSATCSSARVLDTQASDHRPLLVEVRLRER
jgi:endonuclease/exonuclease/phosphatase family metal-dependent hydrolase